MTELIYLYLLQMWMYEVIFIVSPEFKICISDRLPYILRWCLKSKNVRTKDLETYILKTKVVSTLIFIDIIIITIITNLYMNIVTLKWRIFVAGQDPTMLWLLQPTAEERVQPYVEWVLEVTEDALFSYAPMGDDEEKLMLQDALQDTLEPDEHGTGPHNAYTTNFSTRVSFVAPVIIVG